MQKVCRGIIKCLAMCHNGQFSVRQFTVLMAVVRIDDVSDVMQ